MKTRAITGFFFIIVLVGTVLLGRYAFIPFFSLIGLLALSEFYKIVRKRDVYPLTIIGLGTGILQFAFTGLYLLGFLSEKFLLIPLLGVFCVYIISLYEKSENPIQNIAFTLTGFIYTIFPFTCFIYLGFIQGNYNFEIPLGFLILLWTNDTGAYLSGKSFGKRKLFERISPNKTWEGFIGGVVLAVIVSLNLARYFESLNTWEWVVVGVIIGIFGTLGDLVESMLKRNYNIKDSGNILPGHGGVLDRFDGLLISAPLVYIFLSCL